jgi:hypothetical protein
LIAMRTPTATLLALLLAAPGLAAALPPAPVVEAFDRAVPVHGGRVEIADYRPELAAHCTVTRAELPSPLAGSGRIPVRLSGALPEGGPCDGWGWAVVRVLAPVLVTSRAVPAGSPLSGAVTSSERELLAGRSPISRLPADAVASRPMAAGQVVDERDLRVGPAVGDAVTVTIRFGGLRVEQSGRAVPCSRGRACAQMPSGKRVEGTWQDGRILVESP